MSCHVMSCHVMSCHVMSCRVVSCRVVSCHVMLSHVVSFSGKYVCDNVVDEVFSVVVFSEEVVCPSEMQQDVFTEGDTREQAHKAWGF
jgi:hypothetical protein